MRALGKWLVVRRETWHVYRTSAVGEIPICDIDTRYWILIRIDNCMGVETGNVNTAYAVKIEHVLDLDTESPSLQLRRSIK